MLNASKVLQNRQIIAKSKYKKSVATDAQVWYIINRAGVVKLADALDSKSCGLIIRVGSSPTTGSNEKTIRQIRRIVFYLRQSLRLRIRIGGNKKQAYAVCARSFASARRWYKQMRNTTATIPSLIRIPMKLGFFLFRVKQKI